MEMPRPIAMDALQNTLVLHKCLGFCPRGVRAVCRLWANEYPKPHVIYVHIHAAPTISKKLRRLVRFVTGT
jgi:hypothetical protein